jgi:DNA-binding response OmpR family regulator
MEGHGAALAPQGAEGPRHLRERAVDLVISDIFMGRGVGTETVAAIRRISRDIPIITRVGGAGDIPDSHDEDYAQNLQTMRLVDATTTIAKPFKPRDLVALIRQCLEGRSPRQGSKAASRGDDDTASRRSRSQHHEAALISRIFLILPLKWEERPGAGSLKYGEGSETGALQSGAPHEGQVKLHESLGGQRAVISCNCVRATDGDLDL